MGYEWAHLVFIEKWRLHANRGLLVAVRRPFERTYFEVRLPAGGWQLHQPATFVDLLLWDVGEVIAEKRLPFLQPLSVIPRAVVPALSRSDRPEKSFPLQSGPGTPRLRQARRLVAPDALIQGQVLESDGDRSLLIDCGFRLVATVQDRESLSGLALNEYVAFTLTTPLQGFLLTG